MQPLPNRAAAFSFSQSRFSLGICPQLTHSRLECGQIRSLAYIKV
jgi:hypothetical protein